MPVPARPFQRSARRPGPSAPGGLLVLLLLACLVTGCDADDGTSPAEPEVETFFEATLNGEPWSAMLHQAGLNAEGRLTVGGQTHDGPGFWQESLSFSVPFRGAGTYDAVWGEREGGIYGGLYAEADGDALLARYFPLPDPDTNFITITRYEFATGLVEGHFRTTFVVSPDTRVDEPGEPPRQRPDTLRFTDGRFRLVVRTF